MGIVTCAIFTWGVGAPRALVAAERRAEMVTRSCFVIPAILGSSIEDFYPRSSEASDASMDRLR
jgi:hypothetical protein